MVTKEAFRRGNVTKVIFEALFKVFMYRSKKRHAKLVPGYDVVVVKRGSIFHIGNAGGSRAAWPRQRRN